MATCPVCGKETRSNTPFCSYCGATLLVQQTSASSGSYSAQPPLTSYERGAGLSVDLLDQRYERALKRAEQLGSAVLILSIILLILLI